MDSDRTPAQVLDVTTLEDWHEVIEEEYRCCACGDEFEVGEQLVWEPSAWMPDVAGAVEAAHAHCAVKNGYRLRYRGDGGWAGDS